MNNWHFTPIAILYFIAAAIAFALSFIVWNMKDVNGKKHFRYLTFFSGFWTISYTMMFFSTNASIKLILLRFEYLGVICAVLFWLFFVISYTNSDNWLSRPIKILILIIPIFTFIQVLTFQQHNFFYISFDFVESNGFLVTNKVYGPGFYIWIFYSYAVMFSGCFILLRSILKMPLRFRRQLFPMIASIFVVLAPNFLYITGNNPIEPHDPTCLSFVIVGFLFFMLIYFDNFLNIVPVAYNLVFRSTKSGVIIINENGLILDVNPAAEKIFDMDQQEVVGSSVFNYLTDFKEAYDSLRNNQEFRVELDFAHKNRYYELISASLKDYKKRILGRILVFYDITIRKRALHELDAYARTVAHDLKNPMNSIYGFAQLLSNSNNLNDEEKMCSDYIYNGILKMIDITDGLLLLSQVRNQEEIEIETVDTGKLLRKVTERLESLIEKSQCEIVIADKWPLVLGYPIWIEEIWANYISNAIKYGGNPPKVELGYTEMKDVVKFWVKDNGKGLTPEEIKLLFKEFSQLENNKDKIIGYGLGLSIVERIISKLDGTAGVESELGKGSSFYFTLSKK
jgi:PAS domain S-box-containing protein